MIGDDVTAARDMLQTSYPIENGIVQNWPDMIHLYNYTFGERLKIDPTEHKIMLTEAANNPKQVRGRLPRWRCGRAWRGLRVCVARVRALCCWRVRALCVARSRAVGCSRHRGERATRAAMTGHVQARLPASVPLARRAHRSEQRACTHTRARALSSPA